jgi:hypothetical protein
MTSLTNLVPAVGLTKILVREKHAELVRPLGLKDVKDYLYKDERLDCPDPTSLTYWSQGGVSVMEFHMGTR